MRIGIDASPLVQAYGGIGTYVRELLSALLPLLGEDRLFAYAPTRAPLPVELTRLESESRLTWVRTERFAVRWRGFTDHLDLFHGTNYKAQTHGRQGAVITIHDLWLDRRPEHTKKILGQRLSFYRTRRRVWKARLVIAVSQFTAREVGELYGLPPDRIAVIHHGVSKDFYPGQDPSRLAALRARYGLPDGPFVLFVGGAEPRKNHRTLFQAFAATPDLYKNCALIVVGNPTHRLGNIDDTTRALSLGDRVGRIPALPAADLRVLYAHASLFVLPSLYEGFGLPVLEAMACGTPVVTSSRTASEEVAGDAALLVDPEQPAALAEALGRALGDSALRESLRARGLARAGQFTWEKTARQTLQVYRRACEMGERV